MQPRAMSFDFVARIANARVGALLVGAWALGEAILVPIVPDVLLCLCLLVAPRRLPILFGAVVAGALAGTAILYAMALFAPDAASSLVLAVPGITPHMLDAARGATAGGDPLSMAGVGPGTPLKVYTLAWAAGAGGPIGLALGAIANRLTRIGPDAAVAALIGWLAPGFVRRHSTLIWVAYAAFWIGLYAWYLG